VKTFVSRSGKTPPLAVKTRTELPPIFVQTSTSVPSFTVDDPEVVLVAAEIDQTEEPIAPEDNTTTTARPDPSWTKRELIDYAEEHGIPCSPGECKSKVYAEVTAGLTTSQEDSNGDSG
jgi:hypothetical protein